MKLCAFFTVLLLLFSAAAIMTPDYADAARMGGGRSFGSKPFMSKPAPAPARQNPGAGAAQAGAVNRPGGMFGGMGGLMGGLLAGTLLGSLLGGNGFSGGGFMDILLLGIIAYIAYKLFMRFKTSKAPAPAAGGLFTNRQNSDINAQPMARQDNAPSGWGMLRNSGSPSYAQPATDLPPDFNADEFLKGAKMAYTRMQKAWDNRDLADISQFATPAVIDNLREQAKADPNPGKTEIMLVNARLEGFEKNGPEERAEVLFDVLMREDPSQTQPEQVREIWHFVRKNDNDNWKLDGIQQVEA